MRISSTFIWVATITISLSGRAWGQQTAPAAAPESHVPLSEAAMALGANRAPVLEARLLTTMLNGSPDSPVTNIRLVIKNASRWFYNYVSGWVTFYDSGGVRCGEGAFKVDALAPGESAEADTPGLRLRCSPATWRIVATNLLIPSVETAMPAESRPVEEATQPSTPGTGEAEKPPPRNFIISIDKQEHPAQLNNPIVLKIGGKEHTIVIRSVP